MENKTVEVKGKEYKAEFIGTVTGHTVYVVHTEKSYYELYETAIKGNFAIPERKLKGYSYFRIENDIIVPVC